VTSSVSRSARAYLARGGLGLLIGDGSLTRYGYETAIETYYDAELAEGLHAALDGQLLVNPGYNAARGPVPVLGLRLHGEF
jgi:high affinity Mn2+ porin